MKKISVLVAILCIIGSNVSAQLEKGSIMLGSSSTIAMGGGWGSELMSLGFSKTKYQQGTVTEDDYTMTYYNLLPRAGYFVIDNLVAGLEVVISGYVEKDIDDDDTWKESLLAAGPFVRYYYPLDRIYPFAEAEFLFGAENENWLGDEDNAGVFVFSGFVGAGIPLGGKVTLDVLAGYTGMTETYEDGEDGGNSKYYTGGFGIRMGFSVYL
ncbi:hypothetical protein EG827_02745 [bacterium]|nr:hypothetical protein [bacterium]